MLNKPGYLVGLVYSVCLVCLTERNDPDEPDRPGRPGLCHPCSPSTLSHAAIISHDLRRLFIELLVLRCYNARS